MPASQSNSNSGRDYFVGNVEAQFVLTGEGVRILYADRAGDSQAARNKAGDDIAETLMLQRGGRADLAGLNTNNPGKVATFGGVIRSVMFSVYCKGHCKNGVAKFNQAKVFFKLTHRLILWVQSSTGDVRDIVFYQLPQYNTCRRSYV